MGFHASSHWALGLLFALVSTGFGSTLEAEQEVLDVFPTHGPVGGPFVPPGTLYDNGQSNSTSALASQNGGAFTTRAADDFLLDGTACGTRLFSITRIRLQMTLEDAAPQSFALELFADNGSATAPESGISPIASFPEASQVLLGPAGVTSSLYEVIFETDGLELDADTVYWLSGLGTDDAANSLTINAFFAASDGAPGTPTNGVFIGAFFGAPDWVPVEDVAPSPFAFAFAIDGSCRQSIEIPTQSAWGLALLAALLGILSLFVLARRS